MADRILRRCWWLPLALLAAPASAAEWLSGSQLARHCDAFLGESFDGDGDLCVSFVQGYLAGAETIRELAALYGRGATASGARGDESLSERAARTRAGSYLQGRPVAGDAPRYCLPDGISARAVVEQVTGHLQEHDGEPDLTAAQAVHRALVRRFPCEDDG